ncbi:hypothetical protein HYU08_03380 [Candidatus Woesearchaeota archaeon]|nr:hypothetical protein [Candidatus Woesearchaeota archaeon]
MEIALEGILSAELVEKASRQNMNYLVCGVDVYRRPEIAAENNISIDRSRRLPFEFPGTLHFVRNRPEMFFSGRHYRIISLDDLNEYDPYTTIADVKGRLRELQVDGFGFLIEEYLEIEDGEVAYVLTPLTDQEMDKLIRED